MSDTTDDFAEFERIKRHKLEHPKGWEPGVIWTGNTGSITVEAENEPDPAIWAFLIEDWDLDPKHTEIVPGSVQVRAWDANLGSGEVKRMKYYRATLRPVDRKYVDRYDIDRLCAQIVKRRPSKIEPPTAHRAFLVLLSDWQMGKSGEKGGGSEQIIERINTALDRAVTRVKEMKKLGRPVGIVYLIGLGDLVEGCDGFYEAQTFSVDLNRREQMKIVRRLLLRAVDLFVDLGLPVVLSGVPGNHGENRKNGKMFTSFDDNDDVACIEQVAEILQANPDRYQNVSVPTQAINAGDLTLTLDICGVPVGFAHGHQFRNGANSQAKMENYLRGQALGRQSVGDAEILFAGHLHHFVVSEGTGRTVIQVPALDTGSRWFTETSGASAPTGMVTCVISSSNPRGWSELEIV